MAESWGRRADLGRLGHTSTEYIFFLLSPEIHVFVSASAYVKYVWAQRTRSIAPPIQKGGGRRPLPCSGAQFGSSGPQTSIMPGPVVWGRSALAILNLLASQRRDHSEYMHVGVIDNLVAVRLGD